MKKVRKHLFVNEQGLTLIEVLASIVILTIILTSLLTVFVQSTKTTQISRNTIDATYIAQTEMERMYELSRKFNFDDLKNRLKNDKGYTELSLVDNFERYEKPLEKETGKITLKLREETSLIRVIVQVHDERKLLVQMENLLEKVDADE